MDNGYYGYYCIMDLHLFELPNEWYPLHWRFRLVLLKRRRYVYNGDGQRQ
jgi:hypothetical protein